MAQHIDQRVGVFVDVQNMYYSAKHLYNAKVNYANILKAAVANRRLVRAIAYVIKADVKDETDFFDALEKIGFDIQAKDLQIFFGGAKKGDWDVGIAMDIMRLAGKLDVIVLVSGDGDFKELLEHVKSLGCRAEVMAFERTASSRIKGEADLFTDFEKNKTKYLIFDRRHFSEKAQETRPQAVVTEISSTQEPPSQMPIAGQDIQPIPAVSSTNESQSIPMPAPVQQAQPAERQERHFEQRRDMRTQRRFDNGPSRGDFQRREFRPRDNKTGAFDNKPGGFRDNRPSGFRDNREGGFRDNKEGGFRDNRDNGFRRTPFNDLSAIQRINMEQPKNEQASFVPFKREDDSVVKSAPDREQQKLIEELLSSSTPVREQKVEQQLPQESKKTDKPTIDKKPRAKKKTEKSPEKGIISKIMSKVKKK